MKILIASSPNYDDSMAVGAVIDELVQQAAGEVVTLFLAHSGGACEVAYRLVHDQQDAGLEVHFWQREPIDRTYIWIDLDVAPPVTIPTSGPITVFGNTPIAESSYALRQLLRI